MGALSQTTPPQIPPPHLRTRTLASPACVSQMPLTSPPVCAFAGGAASNAAINATIKPNLQATGVPQKSTPAYQQIQYLQCHFSHARAGFLQCSPGQAASV